MENQNIIELKHQLRKIESAKQYIQVIESRLEAVEQKLTDAEAQLRKENKDVEKLKSVSLTHVLTWFTKDKEERLLKEENEAMRAAVYLKQIEEEKQSLDREYAKYQDFIAQEDQIRTRLERCQLEALPSSKEKEELLALRHQLETYQLEEKEYTEAIDAGYHVLGKLKTVLSEVSSAQGWGMYDIVGGGLVSSLIKHSHIDEAQRKIADLQNDILRFQKEVKDVSEITQLEFNFTMGSFVDIVFDNIFTDFMVQREINAMMENVQMVYGQINSIVDLLLDKRQQSETAFEQTKKEYQEKLLDI